MSGQETFDTFQDLGQGSGLQGNIWPNGSDKADVRCRATARPVAHPCTAVLQLRAIPMGLRLLRAGPQPNKQLNLPHPHVPADLPTSSEFQGHLSKPRAKLS